MGFIGTPSEYNAIITDAMTLEPLVYLPWSMGKWQRARSRISQADVFVAQEDGGIETTRAIKLEPWNQLLRIERDGEFVWDGPITSWSSPTRSAPGQKPGFTLRAHDRAALTMKRVVGSDINASIRTNIATLFRDLLISGDLGTAVDPYTFNVPAASEFMSTYSYNAGGTEYTYSSMAVDREYRVSRLERLFDVLTELAELGLITFVQVVDKMWVNEITLRNLLGDAFARPVLSEATVLSTPGVEVDGLGMANKVYAGTQGQGKAGFPTVADCTFFASTYVDGTLEMGFASPRSGQTDEASSTYSSPLSVAAAAEAARAAAPTVTIEQVPLAPTFGSPAMESSLANLVPGVIFGMNFSETSRFNVPFVGVNPEYRYWYTASIFGVPPTPEPRYAYMFTPVSSAAIDQVRLEQLDVSFSSEKGSIVEDVSASLVPYASWDGTVPPNWPVDLPPRGPNLYLE